MARTGPGANPNPSSNPGGSPPPPPPPPPPASGPQGPTGTSGFLMQPSSIQTLQGYASDLQSRYQGVAGQLSTQTLAVNALGMFGIPMVVAVNGSNGKSIDKANHAAQTMGQVKDGLQASLDTQVRTDEFAGSQFDKIVTDSGAKNPQGAPASAPHTPAPVGPQVTPVDQINGDPGSTGPKPAGVPAGPQVTPVDQINGDPGSTGPKPAGAPTGPQVTQFEPPPGATNTPTPTPTPTPAGPPVTQYTPPPGNTDVTTPTPTPTPAGPPVTQYTPPPGGPNTPTPTPTPTPAGPPVTQYTPPPGNTDVTTTAATPMPAAPPVTPMPPIPGANGVPNPGPIPTGAMPPIPPMPAVPPPGGTPRGINPPGANPPGGNPRGGAPGTPGRGPVAPPSTNTTPVNAMWPPAGPRPGAVPNVPGVVGPPQGIFTPTPPAADSLKPIADANPPRPAPPAVPMPDPGPGKPPGPLDPLGGHGPKGDAAPPVVTGGDKPAPQPASPPAAQTPPQPQPVPPPVKPVMAPPNILDLLDPRGYPGGENLPAPDGPKADAAWPATTIDGKPWADLQNLTPEQSQKWIDNLRNILDTKTDGAFFWSGSLYDSDGNRISVMTEAEYMAKADGRNTLEGTLDDKGIKLPGWGNTSPEGKAVWDSVSASLAHGAKGDVYVLLGPQRRPDNVFHMTEFPILQQNPNVNRVIAIDVLNKQETVIFTRQ